LCRDLAEEAREVGDLCFNLVGHCAALSSGIWALDEKEVWE
jgi:hypothetical protein